MNNEKQNIVPELRFPEFQNNWNIVKLKDVSTYFNGKSFEGNVQAKGNYELITLKSIDTDGNLVHSNRFINDKVPTLAKETLVMINHDLKTMVQKQEDLHNDIRDVNVVHFLFCMPMHMLV